MPKHAAALALLVLMVMLAAGCQSVPEQEGPLQQNQDPAGEEITIAGIYLGCSADTVTDILGDDYVSELLHDDGSWFGEPASLWRYGDDLEVLIGEDSSTVLQIKLWGNGYSTSRGDRVGDRADKVLPAYEKEYALATDHFEGKELPGWFVVKEGEWLIFTFEDDGSMVNQVIDGADQVVSIHLVYEKFMD